MFLLECPRCHNRMKYQPKGPEVKGKKKCVYCNFSMDANKSIVQEI
jgi:hypothetical protein